MSHPMITVGEQVRFRVNDHYGRIITVTRVDTEGGSITQDLLPSSNEITVSDTFVSMAIMNIVLKPQGIQLVFVAIYDKDDKPDALATADPIGWAGRALLREPSPFREVRFQVQSLEK